MKYIVILASIVFMSSCEKTIAQSFGYEQPLGSNRIVLVPSEGVLRQYPYADDTFFCNNQEYICFKHSEWWFSIPVDFKETEQEWVYNGVFYCVAQYKKNFHLLGRLFNLYHIRSSEDTEDNYDLCAGGHEKSSMEYLYSKEYGLISIKKIVVAEKTITLISSGEKGFGAME